MRKLAEVVISVFVCEACPDGEVSFAKNQSKSKKTEKTIRDTLTTVYEALLKSGSTHEEAGRIVGKLAKDQMITYSTDGHIILQDGSIWVV